MPGFLAIEVVGIDARRTEADITALTVGCGRAGAVRIALLGRLVLGVGHPRLPAQFAAGAVEAHERTPILLLHRLRDEHTVSPDDGRRVATVRQLHPPANVLVRGPFNGQILFNRYTRSLRPAPGGPVSSRG